MQNVHRNILNRSNQCFKEWQHISINERCNAIRLWADNIEQNESQLSSILSTDVQKPITQSIAEIKKCVTAMRWFADEAEKFRWEHAIPEGAIKHQPFGPIFGIMPFNFPCWQTIRFLIPTLLSGCTAIIKTPKNGHASIIAFLQHSQHLPEHLISVTQASHAEIEALIKHDIIRGVSFTGSTQTARIISSYCALSLKPIILELGGNDAYIVCDDADIDLAVNELSASRLRNSGQACNAAKRIILDSTIKDVFIKKLCDKISTIRHGPLHDPLTEIGPLITKDAHNYLANQIKSSQLNGANIIYQGPQGDTPNYFPPMILSNINKKCPAYNEELFGPVFSIYDRKHPEAMITLANDTPYGLCAGVFTQNTKNAQSIMSQLNAGQVCHNKCFSSSPHLPFTGIKESGIGTECSRIALTNFTYPKLLLY